MPEVPVPPDNGDAGRMPLVLIVGDTTEYPKIFELLADKLGVRIHIAKGCEDAVAAVKSNSFDLIAMDWILPDENGVPCARRIRDYEEGLGRRTNIIGITGHIRANAQSCYDAGLDDYLPMPFTVEQLQEKLKKWMRTR